MRSKTMNHSIFLHTSGVSGYWAHWLLTSAE